MLHSPPKINQVVDITLFGVIPFHSQKLVNEMGFENTLVVSFQHRLEFELILHMSSHGVSKNWIDLPVFRLKPHQVLVLRIKHYQTHGNAFMN